MTMLATGNLLTNPGCEDRAVSNSPNGWTSLSSTPNSIQCLDLGSFTSQSTPSGSYAFVDNENDGNTKTVEQVVGVTAGEDYQMSGLVGTDSGLSGSDYGRVEVVYLDSGGSVIGGSGTTIDNLRSDTDTAFDSFSATSTAPGTAAEARIRVSLVNTDGSYADAMFDDLSFALVPGEVLAVDDGFRTRLGGVTLSPSNSLFDDNGNGSDSLGSPAGDLASFGGGEAGGTVTSNAAGASTSFAGGTLTVNGDGSFSLSSPTQAGAFTFQYRISNGTQSDDATVYVQVSDNLVANPSCEVRGSSNVPTGWTDQSAVTPSVACLDPGTFSSQVPSEGTYVFADDEGSGTDKTLQQTVPVNAGSTYDLTGTYGTDDSNSATDYGRVELVYLDGGGSVLSGGEVTLDNLRSSTNTAMDGFATETTAPTGATEARIRLVFVNADNDQYVEALFDTIGFREGAAALTANDDGGFSTTVDRTLSPAQTLLDDNGNGPDRLGTPAGTVASFGGGDAGGTVTSNAAGGSTALAGGSLTVNSDGSFSLTDPTQYGTFTFQYRLSNATKSDDATVSLSVARNQLLNPSCERADGNNAPSFWTDLSTTTPSVNCLDPTTFSDQTPVDGSEAFVDNEEDGTTKTVQQTVPVAAGQYYALGGYVGLNSTASATDYGRVELVYLDGAGSVLSGGEVTLDGLQSDTDTAMDAFSNGSTAPAGAAEARLRLVMVDTDGGYAEAMFDNLSFTRGASLPVAGDDGGFSVHLGGTLAPSNTLLDDNGNGSDDRGGPPADVASFGGGDLGGTVTDTAAGSSASLAGGTLTVNADGTFSLSSPSQAGSYTFDYRLTNTAGSDDATVFLRVLAPEATLLGDGTTIADGDATPATADGTDFGSVPLDGSTATQTFTVRNDGTAALALDGTPRVNVSGSHAEEFAVTSDPAATVAPGGSTTFTVTFTPDASGVRTATVSLATNDTDEDPYEFALAGTGSAVAPTATTGSAGQATSANATLNGTVDAGGDAATTVFDYFPTGSPGSLQSVTADGSPVTGISPVAVNATLTGLDSDTEYTYRVRATNGVGSDAGTNRTFRTLPDPPEVATLPAPTLAERQASSATVADLDATDGDGGAVDAGLTYTITAGNPDADADGTDVFALDGSTGVLTVADPDEFDYERATGYDVDVRIDDASLSTNVTVSVTLTDDAPAPAADLVSTPEGTAAGTLLVDVAAGNTGDLTSVTYGIDGGNSDVDGDSTPAFAIDSANGTLTVADPGDLDFEVRDRFDVTVTATDGTTSANATVTVTLTDVNDAPTIGGSPPATTAEDDPFGFTPTANDQDGDTLSFAVTNPPAWATFDSATGNLSGTPTNADVGTTTDIEITVSDPSGANDTVGPFDLTVTNTNDAPQAGTIPDQSATEDSAFAYSLPDGTFTDVDAGDTLTLSATTPGWLTFDPSNGNFSGTPANADVGTATVTVTATDTAGANASTAFDVTVANVNDAPQVAAVPNQSATEDSAFAYSLPDGTFTDVDAGDTLTLSATTPGWLTFDPASGNLTGTPTNADVGTATVTVTATDTAGANASTAFDVTVANTNDAPQAGTIPDQSATEDSAFAYSLPDGTFSDVDSGDTLTLSATTPGWLTFDPASGNFSGTPANADVGAATVTVTATDTAGANASTAFDVAVVNTNDAPTIGGTPSTTVDEDSPYLFTPTANDVDAGDSLTFAATNAPSWTTFDTATGELSGTPVDADVGTTTGIEITVTDAAGANDTLGPFDLTVVNTNDPPIVADTGPFAVRETTPLGAAIGDVNATDGDRGAVDGNLTYALLSGTPDHDGDSTPAFAIDGATGVLTVADADDLDVDQYPATASLTVEATDTGDLSTTATVAVTVTAIDEPPSFTATGPFGVDETAPPGTIVGNVDAVDGDGGTADTGVDYAITGGNPDRDADATPAFTVDVTTGVLSVTDAGDLDSVSHPNETLTVAAADANTTTTATVNVTVRDSIAPVADAGSDRTVDEDTAVGFDGSNSTDNAGVVDYEWTFGDGTNATGATPAHTYPEPGTYPVTLTVTDAAGNDAAATVAVTVRDTTSPVADAGSDRTVDEDTAVGFDGSNSTDNVGVVDYEWTFGDGANATGPTPTHVYDHPGNYTVTLTATDAAGNADGAAATVTVRDTTSPVLNTGRPRELAVNENGTFSVSVDDRSPIASIDWRFGDGTTATGATVSHAFGSYGRFPVTVTVTDAAGNTAVDTVRVSVGVANVRFVERRVSPTTITAGESVWVTAKVRNVGDAPGRVNFVAYADGQVIASGGPVLPVNDSYSASFRFTLNESRPTPVPVYVNGGLAGRVTVLAPDGNDTGGNGTDGTDDNGTDDFSVAISNGTVTPTTVTEGDSVTVTADVTADGTDAGTANLSLSANDSVVATDAVALSPGQTVRVVLTYSPAVQGRYDLALNGVDLGPVQVVDDGRGSTPPAVGHTPPTDPDGDGLYDDVDGDGNVSVADAELLFDARSDPAVTGSPEAYDFDGDGRFTLLDVQTLYVEAGGE